MQVRTIRRTEYEEARQLLSRCGWTTKVQDPALFVQAVENSQIALVAEHEGRIIGFLRAITDGTFNGYISMVAVEQEFRGQGVGKALVQAAVGSNQNITWVLRADRDGVAGFYESLGFRPSKAAMERRRSAA
jgi:ribosomal protein S18 acetylase RimI-like enzyme